jgi:regulator of sigma E protease
MSFIAVILVFGMVIFIHELGHFMAAKLSHVMVLEFCLGMGPKLFGFKGKETEYVLRLLPIGGMCVMAGEPDGLNKDEPPVYEESRRFDRQPPWIRAVISVAGPMMNFVLAVALFVLIFSALGIPAGYDNQIQEVVPASVAEDAGILAGDRLVSVDGKPTSTWNDILLAIQSHSGETINVELERQGQVRALAITPQVDAESGRKMIGIKTGPGSLLWEKVSPMAGIQAGFSQAGATFVMIIQALRQLFSGGVAIQELSGPVGIVQVIAQTAKEGLVSLAYLTAFLSINIGICNLLPIPALDGGKLLFIFISVVTRRPINPEKEGMIHFAGLVMLLMLMVVITYFDVLRILKP